MHFRDSSTRLGLRALWFTGAALALAACNNGGGHHAAVVSDAFEGARVITPATAADDLFDPSINGSRAEGKVGDVVMANSRIKVIIQAPGRDEGVGPQGGTIIDADIRRPAGEEGMDSLAEITPMFQIGMTALTDEVQIVQDGGATGTSVVVARGPGGLLDVLDFPGLLNTVFEQLGGLGGIVRAIIEGGFGQFFPRPDITTRVETRYELPPDAAYVKITTTVLNDGTSTLVTPPGDLIDAGGDLEWFIPSVEGGLGSELGFGEPVVPSLAGLGLPLGIGVIDWIGYFGDRVSYGYMPPRDGTTGLPDAIIISAVGIGGMVLGSSNVGDIFFPNLDTSPYLRVAPGGNASYTRYFVVGDGTVDSIARTVWEIQNVPTGTVRGRVTAAGSSAPLAGVRITALKDGDLTKPINQFRTGADGTYEGTLPPGSYGLIAAQAFDFGDDNRPSLLTPVMISVEADGAGAGAKATTQDLVLGQTGTLRVEIRDVTGGGSAPLPGKVTVVGLDPTPRTKALMDVSDDPLTNGIAQVYFLTGEDRTVDIEPGEYEIVVSHGPEYDLVQQRMTIGAGDNGTLRANLTRVVDTTGFISGEFHVHSAGSPDSPVANDDRVRNFVADDVELMVPTEHDNVVDFDPVITRLGLRNRMAQIVGLEITPLAYGHYNVWPITVREEGSRTGGAITHTSFKDLPVEVAGADPSLSAFEDGATPAQIFEAGEKTYPGTQVLMVNHARSASLGYFDAVQIDWRAIDTPAETRVDPRVLRMAPNADLFVRGSFTAMEIMNNTSLASFSELFNDWLALTHLGERISGTAVSDTHVEVKDVAGWGRTYVPVAVEDPAAINAMGSTERAAFNEAFAQAINAQRTTCSLGLFVTAELQDDDAAPSAGAVATMGETLTTATPGGFDGTAELRIRVQSPPWLTYDRIEVFVNTPGRSNPAGDLDPPDPAALNPEITLNLDGPPGAGFSRVMTPVAGSFRYETNVTVPITVTRDAFVIVVARGTPGRSRTLFPVVPQASFPDEATLDDFLVDEAPGAPHAVGFTNPIFLDADGNGRYDADGVSGVLPPLAGARKDVPAVWRLRSIAAMTGAAQEQALRDFLVRGE
ncbi:MAG: hypothetical protein KC466_06090 [Myxococcales bacterium]|nr:hypothetical protein [Myxococcales bacterium]